MQMLYESAKFVVVHVVVNRDEGGFAPLIPRNGFEIVNKETNLEVFLVDKWAAIFQAQINAWQANTPTEAAVEEMLERYAALAQYPLVTH